MAEKAYFALTKYFRSKPLKNKVKLYVAIIRSTHTYGCEAWTTTSQTERKLKMYETKFGEEYMVKQQIVAEEDTIGNCTA